MLVKASGYIEKLYEDGLEDNVVVLKGVGCQIDTRCINRILKFAELTEFYQVKIKKPIQYNDQLQTIVPPAFAEYLGQFSNDDDLCHMILVANFLQCEDLLDLLSAHLAIKLATKKPEQIRDYFGVHHGFVNLEQDMERIERENEDAAELLGLNDDN